MVDIVIGLALVIEVYYTVFVLACPLSYICPCQICLSEYFVYLLIYNCPYCVCLSENLPRYLSVFAYSLIHVTIYNCGVILICYLSV